MGVYLFVLGLVGQALFQYALRAWRQRDFPGLLSFFVMQVALVAWIACYLGEQLDPDRATLWFALKFLPISLVAPSWFLFSLVYTKVWTQPLRAWYLVYLWAATIPFVTLTNDHHHWFFREIVMRNELVGLNGPLFLFHVSWNYLLLTSTAGLLLYHALRSSRRGTTVTLLVAGMIPWGGSILNEFTKDPVSGQALLPVNPTLPAFIISTLIFGWVVFRQRLLDPRPLARDRLFTVLQDGLVVLDAEGSVADVNDPARRLLGLPLEQLLGRRLEALETPLKSLAKAQTLGVEQDEPWEVRLEKDGEAATYHVRVMPLRDGQGKPGGWLLSMRCLGNRRTLERMEEMGLSPREQELVEWVNQGLSNKEIAVILDIGPATVKNHLYNVFRKCGVGSRQELLRVLRKANPPSKP